MFRPRQPVPPPQRATWADLYRIGLGALMIPLGITILVRSFQAHVITPASILMGMAFVGFGTYRLYVGVVRYRMYRETRRR